MGGGGFRHSRGLPNGNGGGSSASALDTMHESDAYSTATETSTLWCEICETAGHDILTCTNMFGPQAAEHHHQKDNDDGSRIADGTGTEKTGRDVVREGLRNQQQHQHLHVPHSHQGDDEDIKPAPLSPVKSRPSPAPTPVRILPNPMDSGPVAGKESGVVDASKWCALCERDGHDSVDCPFEDAF
ncbi:hypothetical protein VTK73DRAFT_9432 [Phialemonium thermophilum]|uniref:CLIP1 zinc knuckle domain-containing protein n=1 Tax=Phialemonium thermophilum TaxID=223376 RepID=A0ABR3W295_9PEZI